MTDFFDVLIGPDDGSGKPGAWLRCNLFCREFYATPELAYAALRLTDPIITAQAMAKMEEVIDE